MEKHLEDLTPNDVLAYIKELEAQFDIMDKRLEHAINDKIGYTDKIKELEIEKLHYMSEVNTRNNMPHSASAKLEMLMMLEQSRNDRPQSIRRRKRTIAVIIFAVLVAAYFVRSKFMN